MDKPLKLDAIEFAEVPTPSQVADAFTKIHKFVNSMMAHIMISEELTVNDAKVMNALNGAGNLLQSADMWKQSSPIAQPQLVPPTAGRRQ